MILSSVIFAGGCVLALGFLTLCRAALQRAILAVLWGCLLAGLAWPAAWALDDGLLLASSLLAAVLWALGAILHDIRRADAASLASCQAPGAPHGAGDAGERDGERYAPILPGGQSTAERAGRSRSFSGGAR